MPDFREELYRRYVSTLKGGQAPTPDAALQSYWASCERWFLPFLDGLDRAAPILELGCGPGHMMEFLRSHGFANVQGIDVSEEQVRVAAGRGLDAQAADAFDFLPPRQGVFDAIVAIDFIEHFTREELLRLFPLILGALKPGGTLLLQTPNGRGLFPNDVIYGDLTHMTIFTTDSLAQLLRLAGFEGFEFRETAPVARSFRGRIRVVLWRLVRRCANFLRTIEAGKRQDIWTENFICCCRKPEPRRE